MRPIPARELRAFGHAVVRDEHRFFHERWSGRELFVRHRADGLDLWTHALTPGAAPDPGSVFALQLTLRPRFAARWFDGRKKWQPRSAVLTLARARQAGLAKDEAIRYTLELVRADVLRRGHAAGWGHPPEDRELQHAAWVEAVEGLDDLFGGLTAHVWRCCDPAARSIAARFSLCLRATVYRELLADGTGRLAQACVAVPGLVAFAAALERAGLAPLSARLFRGIVAGERALPLIDRGLSGLDRAFGTGQLTGRSWTLRNALRLRPAEELVTLRRSRRPLQRHAIRHAGAGISPRLLLGVPAVGVRIDHWPRRLVDQHRLSRLWEFVPRAQWLSELSPERSRRFVEFLARNPREVQHRRDHGLALQAGGSLTEHTTLPVATRRRVAAKRRADEQQYGQARGRLEPDEQQDWNRDDGDDEYEGPPAPTSGPLPPAPWPVARAGAEWLEPFTTLEALDEHGREMRHCIASYSRSVLAGRLFVYAGVVAGKRITVAIQHGPDGFVLFGAHGMRNAAPAAEVMRRLRHWASTGELPARSGEEPVPG